MALMTPEQFEESLKEVKPRVFMNGKRVYSVLPRGMVQMDMETTECSELGIGKFLAGPLFLP